MATIRAFRALRPAPGSPPGSARRPTTSSTSPRPVTLARGNPDSFLHVSRPDIDLPDGHRSDERGTALRRRLGPARPDRARACCGSDDDPALFVYRASGTIPGVGEVSQTGLVVLHERGRVRERRDRHPRTHPARQGTRPGTAHRRPRRAGRAGLPHAPARTRDHRPAAGRRPAANAWTTSPPPTASGTRCGGSPTPPSTTALIARLRRSLPAVRGRRSPPQRGRRPRGPAAPRGGHRRRRVRVVPERRLRQRPAHRPALLPGGAADRRPAGAAGRSERRLRRHAVRLGGRAAAAARLRDVPRRPVVRTSLPTGAGRRGRPGRQARRLAPAGPRARRRCSASRTRAPTRG